MEGDPSVGLVIGLKRRRDFVIKLCEDYRLFTQDQKLNLLLALAVDLGLQDLSQMVNTLPSLARTHLVLQVMGAALGFSRKNDPMISKNIKRGLVPVPEQFFILMGSVPQGPKFLLNLRVDLRILLKQHMDSLSKQSIEALKYLDVVMRDLFATQAGMRFRRVDLSSEKTLSFILKHERVHSIRSWNDLQRRIAGPNRFCFGLFHLHMPHAPLVFVQVLLTDHLCDNVDSILNEDGPRTISTPNHLMFYSISNANMGLRELNTASHLLFLTIERMTMLYPQIKVAATLSPVPEFRSWFLKALEYPQSHFFLSTKQLQSLSDRCGVVFTDVHRWLIQMLTGSDWYKDEVFVDAIREVLITACAHYVLFERKQDKMLNPVANFHLQNGAQVERICFLADPSPQGIEHSFGMMINYRYCMDSVDYASVRYKRTSAVATALRVSRLVYPSSSMILDEMEKLLIKQNLPLFARVYSRGHKICVRGDLPMAMYFIWYDLIP